MSMLAPLANRVDGVTDSATQGDDLAVFRFMRDRAGLGDEDPALATSSPVGTTLPNVATSLIEPFRSTHNTRLWCPSVTKNPPW